MLVKLTPRCTTVLLLQVNSENSRDCVRVTLNKAILVGLVSPSPVALA